MSGIWFTATKKFDPTIGEEWHRFINWAKLSQLRELISLDTTLRPQDLWNLIDADWSYNIHMDYLIAYFWNLDYLLQRFSSQRANTNILAVALEPPFEVRGIFTDSRFVFQGYDLIGESVSALTNCGGYEKAFQPSDISETGLISGYVFAREVQRRLRQHYPRESHTDCEVWAIWKMTAW